MLGNIGEQCRGFCLRHCFVWVILLSFPTFFSFVNDEALACELAGHFYLKSDRKDVALQYFMLAHEKYHEWGAAAKSNALFKFVQQELGPSSSLSDPATLDLTTLDCHGESNVRKRGHG